MNPFRVFPAAMLLVAMTACAPSTEELTKQVRASMESKYASTGVTIKSLVLTKKGGNEYVGVLETQEPNGAFTYTVEVISDGKNITWQTKQN